MARAASSIEALSSESVPPMIMGIFAVIGGASGSHGWRGTERPSKVGAPPPPPFSSASIGRSSSVLARDLSRPSRASTPSAARVAVSRVRRVRIEPLWMMALCTRPSTAGMARSCDTSEPPDDQPNTVTLPGSPPKAAMLSRTHRRAAMMSSTPELPLSA